MKKIIFFLSFLISAKVIYAQDTLPKITVKNMSGRIIISWMNNYTLPIANINIQRSYDSLKNYTTIGSVLNPQNVENGYTDVNPPYNKMYYRVFVGFEGGTYVITPPVRPVKIIPPPVEIKEDSIQLTPETDSTSVADSTTIKTPVNPVKPPVKNPVKPPVNPANPPVVINTPPPPPPKPVITYPSQKIFTSRNQDVVIYLPNADSKKYLVKFFDEENREIFQLSKLTEKYLILEKVNFIHSGWFHFELFEDGELIEKNKFYIPKDSKKNAEKSPR